MLMLRPVIVAIAGLMAAATANGAATCDVAGITVGSNIRYITGNHGVEGSIYAQCVNGQARCFLDTRVRDHTVGDEVACDAPTINASRRKLGVYLKENVKYWPGGVACYTFAAGFTTEQQGVFLRGMEVISSQTPVQFVPLGECAAKFGATNPNVCGGCTQAFQVVNQGGASDCYATLGYAPGQRMDLNFGPSCFNGDGGARVAVHELGHILGLIHEHTHPNRGVIVLRDSLTLSADNYIKETNGLTTEYDVNSVMHYGRDTGLCVPRDRTKNYCDIDQTAADGCVEPTVDMCDASQDNSFGKATTLSPRDVETLARMYGSGANPNPTPAPTNLAPTAVPVPPAPTPAPTNGETATPTVTPAPTNAETATPTLAPAPVSQPPAQTPAPTPTKQQPDNKQQNDFRQQYYGDSAAPEDVRSADATKQSASPLPAAAPLRPTQPNGKLCQ